MCKERKCPWMANAEHGRQLLIQDSQASPADTNN